VTGSSAAVVAVLLALGCAAAAVSLLWPAHPSGRAVAGRPAVAGSAGAGWRGSRWVPVLGLAVLAAGLFATPRQVVLVLILGGAGWGGAALLRRRRAVRAAELTSARLLEACEQLTGELVAGQPPGAALEHCAAHWSLVAPVAEAFRVGADVPGAWRASSRHPGAGDLRLVAAAWQVSHRTGSGLAGALEHVTADLRSQRATQRVVAGELASARATARLVAVLPFLALTVGAGAGGDPWGFLLGHPVGLASLGLGLAFALAGLAWIEALAREVDRA
jgi:tight adherence protein B